MRSALAEIHRPLDQAGLIPDSAAGRQALFFFGTLMDLDILAYVLERPIDLDDLQPAMLHGHRRVAIAGVTYPTLVRTPRGRVRGRLLRRATRRDIARINHLESGEYRAELHPVRTGDAAEHAAWLYMGLEHMPATARPWSLRQWQRRHKAGYFAACDGWMADFQPID